MDVLRDVWQGIRRLHSRKCPKCKVSEADLPPDEHMQVWVVRQHSLQEWGWRKDKNGKRTLETNIIYTIIEKWYCPHCRQEWYETHRSSEPSKTPYVEVVPPNTLETESAAEQPSLSPVEEALDALERLFALTRQGVLTPEEFAAQKRKILE